MTLLALLLGACGRSPRVVTVSPTPDGVRPDASRVTDYPEALAVIVPAMRDVLGLGLPQGAALEIYPDRDGFARVLVKAFGVERPRALDLAGWVQAAASRPDVVDSTEDRRLGRLDPRPHRESRRLGVRPAERTCRDTPYRPA